MDLGAGRRGPLSQEEKAKRILEGRCLYCGGLGHTVRTCTIRPLRGNEATLAPAPPLLPSSLAPAPATPFTQPVEKLGVLQAGDSACVGLPDSLSPFSLSSYSTTVEKEMEGYHMVVTCTLQDGQNSVQTHALVDCGATGYAFIDEDFASRHNFPLFKLSSPRNIRVINGRPIASGAFTHIAKLCYGPPALYTFPPLCTFPTSTYLMPLNPLPYVPVLYTYCCSPRLILIT